MVLRLKYFVNQIGRFNLISIIIYTKNIYFMKIKFFILKFLVYSKLFVILINKFLSAYGALTRIIILFNNLYAH